MYKKKNSRAIALLLTLVMLFTLCASMVMAVDVEDDTAEAPHEHSEGIAPFAYAICPAHLNTLVEVPGQGYYSDLGYYAKYICPTVGCNYSTYIMG
jgi:hypothetical protein